MNRPENHEAAMARADLYKLANYSMKLFKMIHEGQELEGWVQAKITKSADYIASVYHFMEYEMKVSEYGEKLENADVYSESVRRAFAQKLTEAKQKMAKMKKKNEKDVTEELKNVGDTAKTHKGGTVTKTSTGVKHERDPDSYDDGGDDSDEKSGKGKKSHAKSQSAAEKKAKAPAQKKSKSGTWGMEGGEKFDNRKVKEATMVPSPADGATAPPPKGKDGKYPFVVSGPHKGKRWSPQTPGPTNPAFKESSHQEKTTMKHVKNPTAGEKKAAKDIKPGIAGYKDRVDMLKSAEKDGRLKEGSKPDFLDMDKDGNKKEPMKKALKDKKVKESSKLDVDKNDPNLDVKKTGSDTQVTSKTGRVRTSIEKDKMSVTSAK